MLPSGSPTGTWLRSNGTESYTYDALDRLTFAAYPGGGSATYAYDANGNRTSVTSGGSVTNYQVDAADQLTALTDSTNTVIQSYGYDANGNRTTVAAGGVTTTYGYDVLGQLTSITDNAGTPLDLTIAYDNNGNRRTVTDDTTSTVTREYLWDWNNRLTEAVINGVTTEYGYLGDDTRQSLTTGSTTTDYLYDRMGGLPQVVDDGTNAYLHDVTGNLASIDGSDEPTYPLQDGLGSVRLPVDDTGAALGTREWDAWGTLRTSSGPGYGFGWTGEQYDPSSDLTYLRARYYSPGSAQFLSRDTVQPNSGETTGYNPYAYANGNPVTFTDPSGHAAGLAGIGEWVAGAIWYMVKFFECHTVGPCRYQGEYAPIEWELEKAKQLACTAVGVARVAVALAGAPTYALAGTCSGTGATQNPKMIAEKEPLISKNGCKVLPWAPPPGTGLDGFGPWGTFYDEQPNFLGKHPETRFETTLLSWCPAWERYYSLVGYSDKWDSIGAFLDAVAQACGENGFRACVLGATAAQLLTWGEGQTHQDQAQTIRRLLEGHSSTQPRGGLAFLSLYRPGHGTRESLATTQHSFFFTERINGSLNPCTLNDDLAEGEYNQLGRSNCHEFPSPGAP